MEVIDVQMPIGMGVDMDVIEKMQKSKIARAQDKTREELQLINERVKHIFEDYEFGETMASYNTPASNIEFMADMAELQSILGDAIQKNKYQQKITIFIVGFQDVCVKRVQLLNQISEFFQTYGAPDEVEDTMQDSLEGLDVDAIHSNIQTALDTMDSAVVRLNDLNHDIMGFMNTMHSALSSKSNKNRKKLEKNLALAKEDIAKMTDKLQVAQQELKAKEEQLKKVAKQVDTKTKELFNYKTQLEKSGKNLEEVKRELNNVRFSHEDEIKRAHSMVEKLQTELQELKNEKMMSYATKINDIIEASLTELSKMKEQYSSNEEQQKEFRKEIALQYRVQAKQIEYIQSEEFQHIQYEYRKSLSKLLEIQVSEEDIQQWGKENEDNQVIDQQDIDEGDPEKQDSRNESAIDEDMMTPATPLISEKDSSPDSPQIQEDQQPLDLTDEEYWDSLQDNQLSAKFAQFREEANKQINELRSLDIQSSNNEELIQKQREERKKWKNEKATLLDHIQQLQKLQEEAEADADEAMRQLEDFASQERGEEEAPDIRRVSSVEDVHEEGVKNREQATSPEIPKPLSSVSIKSVVSMVEEKRAAMMKRKESATRLLTSSSSGKNLRTPNIQVSTDPEAFENFAKSYKAILQFKQHIIETISRLPGNTNLSKNLDSGVGVVIPDENETDEMADSVEKTLQAIESVFRNVVAAASVRDPKLQQREQQLKLQQQQPNFENEHQRRKITELESEMEMMKMEFGRRMEHDSNIIQQLQNTIANLKQDNIPSNMQITTNTPSASAPVASDHMLTLSQGNRGQTVDPNMTMMFTRLDSEHNTKTLTKSAKNGKINQSTLDSLVATMDSYNDVAASRLKHIVRKMVHHTKMKEIEMNVRNSNLVTSEVFDVLDKMEDLQRLRAQHWSRTMDDLSMRRKRLGMLLQDAMHRLEKITGVFLIKPLISYKGKTRMRKYSGKISTKFNKYQMEAMAAKQLTNLSAKRRHDSNYMKVHTSAPTYNLHSSHSVRSVPWTAQQISKEMGKDPLTVSSLTRVEPPSMWNMEMSLPQTVPLTKKEKWSPNYSSLPASVPRMMELDVGRYLHEINNIHTYTAPVSPLKSPRSLTGTVRTYRGISRTGGTAGTELSKLSSDRLADPRTAGHHTNTGKAESSADDYQSTAPPTTPASQTQIRRGSSGTALITPTSEGLPLASPNLPRPLPPISVPIRSRASTRSSLSGSPMKEYFTPSPTKSVPGENTSPVIRSKSDNSLQGAPNTQGGTRDTSPIQQYVEIIN
ncbi:uncharacterized protein LOC120343157 [Styela clava]